ncbi:MAG: TspO/MBR family protein [Salaquimonas sp.]
MMRNLKFFAIFVALALAVGFTSAFLFPPGAWHAALNKPWFNPPNWIFGPVWTVLYVMIGIAGALAWRWDPQSGAVKVWFFQLILNGAWTAVFFGAHQIEVALIVILALWWAIISFMKRTKTELPSASWLFFPYLLWVSFATMLNAGIAALN